MSEHVYSNSPITGGPATPGPPTPLQAAVSTGHDFVPLAYLNSLGYSLNLKRAKLYVVKIGYKLPSLFV